MDQDRRKKIGLRVKYWRERRRMTRAVFGGLMGYSASWVSTIESGSRQWKIGQLEDIAAVLCVEVASLIDDQAAECAQSCPDTVEVDQIRRALSAYGAIYRPGITGDLARLRKQTKYACAIWLSSDFTSLARVLPDLLAEASAFAEAVGSDEDKQVAARYHVMAYRLAASLLLKLRAPELAWLAADRAIHRAQVSGDIVNLARASRAVARALSATGQGHAAIEVLTGMATRMEPMLGDDTDLWALYGMLLLPGEVAAAHDQNAALAATLHQQADAVARRLGTRYLNSLTAFGPTNVALHRVSALVRLHEPRAAIMFATGIDPAALAQLPAERSANHALDLATAYAHTGDNTCAVNALVTAEQIAPQEVRCRPATHQLISALLRATRCGQLRGLADRAGVAA